MRDEIRDLAVSAALLGWYDTHARTMPWRTGPAARAAGQRPDPYRVWLSEVMLQQTTVAAVRAYFERFTALWPDVHALAAEEDGKVMAEWAGLGYYARARNLLKCARVVASDHGGVFPDSAEKLRQLPGIGPYTAAAIAAIAYDEAATVVDGNVERVIARLHAVETPMPAAKPELTRLAARHTPPERPGDYAQAVMDLGATICTPRNPACGLCPLSGTCAARDAGVQAHLPRRAPKQAKPVRQGTVWIAERPDGALLLERRGETTMLGGMLGWPGTDWDRNKSGEDAPPLEADWRTLGEVRHSFSHFHLVLTVRHARAGAGANPARGEFLPPERFRSGDLPTLMRKAHKLLSARNATADG